MAAVLSKREVFGSPIRQTGLLTPVHTVALGLIRPGATWGSSSWSGIVLSGHQRLGATSG